VTTDGAPAVSYSNHQKFQATLNLHRDFQQVVRRFGLNENGDIEDFYLRITRLSQSLEPGKVVGCANGMQFSDIHYDHISEQPGRMDDEAVRFFLVWQALQAMTGSDNKKKASVFVVWAKHNPTEKTKLDQMAKDFRVAMRKDIHEFKAWAGVDEKFKATHRDRITPEFATPRDSCEIDTNSQRLGTHASHASSFPQFAAT